MKTGDERFLFIENSPFEEVINILSTLPSKRSHEELEKLQNLIRNALTDFEGMKLMGIADFECVSRIYIRKFKQNETIFSSRDFDDSLMIILKGKVGIDKYFGKFNVFNDNLVTDPEEEEEKEFQKSRYIKILLPGQAFGQSCIISDNSGRRPVKATAVDEVALACLDKKSLGKEFEPYKASITECFNILRKQEAFKQWNSFNLKSLLYIIGKSSFPLNSYVVKEGEKMDRFWISKRGEFAVDKYISIAKKGEKIMQRKYVTLSKLATGEIIGPFLFEISDFSIKSSSALGEMFYLSKRDFLNYILSDNATKTSLKDEYSKLTEFRLLKLKEIHSTYCQNENFLTDSYNDKRKNIGLIKANVSNLEGIVQDKRLLDTLKFISEKTNLPTQVKNNNESGKRESREVNSSASLNESKLKRLLKPNKTAGGSLIPGSERLDFKAIISSKLKAIQVDEFSLRSKILSNLQECSLGMQLQDSMKEKLESEINEKLEAKKKEFIKKEETKNYSLQEDIDGNQSSCSQRERSPSLRSPVRVESPLRNEKSTKFDRNKKKTTRESLKLYQPSQNSFQQETHAASSQSLLKIPLQLIDLNEEEEFFEGHSSQVSQRSEREKIENMEREIFKRKKVKRSITSHEALLAKIKSEGDLFLKRINVRAKNISENELRKRTFLKMLRKETGTEFDGQANLLEEEEKLESFNFVRTYKKIQKQQVIQLTDSKNKKAIDNHQERPIEKNNTSIDSKRQIKVSAETDRESFPRSMASQKEIRIKEPPRTLSPEVHKRFVRLRERVLSAQLNSANENPNFFVKIGSPVEMKHQKKNILVTSINSSSMNEKKKPQRSIIKRHERNLTDPSPKRSLNTSASPSITQNATIFKLSYSSVNSPKRLRNLLTPYEYMRSKSRPQSVKTFKKSNSQTMNLAIDAENKLRIVRSVNYRNICV